MMASKIPIKKGKAIFAMTPMFFVILLKLYTKIPITMAMIKELE